MKFPKTEIQKIRKTGAVPFVRFMPRSNETLNEENQFKKEKKFSLQNIIDGKFDKALKLWAEDAIKDNIPLLVDFGVEPNGNWFSWSGVFNGGSTRNEYGDENYPDGAERYRDAYRHIITLFKEVGVRHITWFFHFNYVSFPNEEWN